MSEKAIRVGDLVVGTWPGYWIVESVAPGACTCGGGHAAASLVRLQHQIGWLHRRDGVCVRLLGLLLPAESGAAIAAAKLHLGRGVA